MTVQPVETMTEQEFLGNAAASIPGLPLTEAQQEVLTRARRSPAPRESYLPNGHRLRPPFQSVLLQDIEEARREKILAELNAAAQDTIAQLRDVSARLQTPPAEEPATEPDLWLDAEITATKAVNEIQDGNINAGIAYLQAALAFALNHRHSLAEEVTR